MLRWALTEWGNDCPGAGWEHHGQKALETLLRSSPSINRLLAYARAGMEAEAKAKEGGTK
jgi:hypothetical protein